MPEGAETGNVTVENLVEAETSNALSFTVLPGEEVARGYEAGVSALGMLPREVSVAPDGSIALVAAAEGLAAVMIDPGAPDYLSNETFAIEGGLDGIDMTPNGKSAYAVSGANEKLYRINTELGAGGLAETDPDR